MAYKEDALELINESKNILAEIKTAYEESLHDQEIKPRLLIKIKKLYGKFKVGIRFYCTSPI